MNNPNGVPFPGWSIVLCLLAILVMYEAFSLWRVTARKSLSKEVENPPLKILHLTMLVMLPILPAAAAGGIIALAYFCGEKVGDAILVCGVLGYIVVYFRLRRVADGSAK